MVAEKMIRDSQGLKYYVDSDETDKKGPYILAVAHDWQVKWTQDLPGTLPEGNFLRPVVRKDRVEVLVKLNDGRVEKAARASYNAADGSDLRVHYIIPENQENLKAK